MAGIEDLYAGINRAPDAEGLAYWNQQLAAGTSFEQVAQNFNASAEFVLAREAALRGSSSTGSAGTTVLGRDISGWKWDDLVTDLNNDKLHQSSWSDSYDPYSGYAYSSMLGQKVQGYVDTKGPAPAGVKADDWAGPDPFLASSISAINFKDKDGPYGMMTSLYRNDDGSVGVRYYEEKDNFLKDMALFALTAFAMYTGVGMLGEALGGAGAAAGAAEGAAVGTSGASGSAGAAAAGAGEAAAVGWTSGYELAMGADLLGMTGVEVAASAAALDLASAGLTEFASELGMQAAETIGNLQSTLANVGTGFQPVGTTGFQATGSLGFSATGATPGALGSLAPGAFAAETIGGIAALTPGALLPPTGHLGSLAPGYFGAETLGGLAPLVPKVMTPDLSHLGSLGEGYFAGEGLVPAGGGGGAGSGVGGGAPPIDTGVGKNWWDEALDVVKDIGTGLVVGTVVDKVINGKDGKDGAPGGIGNISINIPKPSPSAAALQPSASQRAGVKFGRTKSKRQLKGKFSGTGLSLG